MIALLPRIYKKWNFLLHHLLKQNLDIINSILRIQSKRLIWVYPFPYPEWKKLRWVFILIFQTSIAVIFFLWIIAVIDNITLLFFCQQINSLLLSQTFKHILLHKKPKYVNIPWYHHRIIETEILDWLSACSLSCNVAIAKFMWAHTLAAGVDFII